MTKRELINELESCALPDNANVKIWDHRRDAAESDGTGPSTAMFDFDVATLNDNLSEEDKEYYREMLDIEPRPFIVLGFDNPDFED